MTQIVTTRAELAEARLKMTEPVIFAPTMGALHDGHRALLRRARELAGESGTVIVSIFVNPLQFGVAEDLKRYPRTLAADKAVCEAEHADIIFAPSLEEMYPDEQLVTVDPGPMGTILEGKFRPGHFSGMLTVVLKLFSLIRPQAALFGEKDAQQLALVRRMVEDFALGIAIEPVPTVRDSDGLALSSRNVFLNSTERAGATALPNALSAGAAAAHGGSGAAVLAAARRVLDGAGPEVHVEYVQLVEPRSYHLVTEEYSGEAVLAVAARVGKTRLIDNVRVTIGAERDAADN